MFWIAAGLSLLIGILIVIVLFMLLSTPRTDKGWAWTIGFFVVGTWIGFVILSLGLGLALLGLYAVYASRRQLPTIMRSFLDFLVERFASPAFLAQL